MNVHKSLSVLIWVGASAVLFQASTASADRFRRRATTSRTYSWPADPTYGVVTDSPPARPEYTADPSRIRYLEFDYRHLLETPQISELTIALSVLDERVLECKESVFASVSYFDLSDDTVVNKVSLPIRFGRKNMAFILVPGLNPESVYKFQVEFFSRAGDPLNPSTHVATAGSFWGVTSGRSKIARARHLIVATMLLENYDWELGRRHHSNAPYLNMSGGWCGLFPHWCSKPYIKVFDEEPSDAYRKAGSFYKGFHFSGAGEAIHGNYGLVGSHKFTVLGYSAKSARIYTVEGNFSNRVRIHVRGTHEFSGYGVINEKLLWEEEPAADIEEPLEP